MDPQVPNKLVSLVKNINQQQMKFKAKVFILIFIIFWTNTYFMV